MVTIDLNYYLMHWIVSSLAVVIMAFLVPGIKIQNFVAAMWAALVIGVINMLVWPVLVVLTIPFTILSFGLFLFIVNGLALKISSWFSPGFSIVGFMPAVWGSLVLSLVGWMVRFVFAAPPATY